jgi:hypothetical protein
VLVPDEDEVITEEPLPDPVEEVDEGDVTTEEVAEAVALTEEDELEESVELGELVGAIEEGPVDAEADPEAEEVEVTEAVTEFEVEEVTSLSSSSVMVVASSPPIEVEAGVSSTSSEEVKLELVVGVMLAEGVPMTIEVTLIELGLTAADDDIIEDDFVVVVVVVGPLEVLLPGMRLR